MLVFCKYFLLFMLYSFFGWVIEMIVCTIADKKVVNRGFLIGPYCPIYGCGCLLIILLLRKYYNDGLVLFIMSVLLCSVLEYFTSYIMEKLFNARWWDYSDRKFNINGRICLETLVLFGILGLLLVYIINPFFTGLIDMMNNIVLIVVASVILVMYVVDICVSLKVISGFKKVARTIKKDNTEEITKKVREILPEKGWLYKRLVSAFNFKISEKIIKVAKDVIEKGTKEAKKIIKAGTDTAIKTIEGTKNIVNKNRKSK